MAEQIVTLAPGESKVISFEAVPHEVKTYQVSVNGLSGSFVAIGPKVSISNVSWENNTDIRPSEFRLVKATITVNNPVEDFTDTLSLILGKYENGVFTPSPSGPLSQQRFMPYEVWLDYLAWIDARIAYCYSVGASNTARIWEQRKPRVQQYRQCDGFVFQGVYNYPDPNVYFDYYLTLNGGNKIDVHGFPSWRTDSYVGPSASYSLFPTGNYSLKAAFTIWTGAEPGVCDVLIEFESKRASFISLNALSIV